MKLDDIDAPLLRKAMEAYLVVAYPEQPEERFPNLDLSGGPTIRELLLHFEDESLESGGKLNRRYILRLGNTFYPHMKLVLEEYLVPDEFFFLVDTHDQMDLKPTFPDYEAWVEMKERNRAIKDTIERSWTELGVPTMKSLRECLLSQPRREAQGKKKRILIVDDDADIVETTALLLETRGFDVDTAGDGVEGLESIRNARPDLIVLDYMMPRMDGFEFCLAVRSDPLLRRIPILLTTATTLQMEKKGLADGFLLKPFQDKVLLSYVRHLLRGEQRKTRRIPVEKIKG